MKLCDATNGAVFQFDGSLIHFAAQHGMTTTQFDTLQNIFPLMPSRSSITARAVLTREVVHAPDLAADLIAIENARLITEQREALEQQTATAEVLQVINASPGNLTPVFDIILDKAMWLCGAAFGRLCTWDGNSAHTVAMRGFPPALSDKFAARGPSSEVSPAIARLYKTKRSIQLPDVMASEGYRNNHPDPRALADLGGVRTFLAVPLRKDEDMLGHIGVYRQEVRAFSDREIALLENFGAQAVIAMENARLLDEVRQRQEELRVTFENMGDGVALFDEKRHLVASNQQFQDILDVPDDVISSRPAFAEYIRYLADGGE